MRTRVFNLLGFLAIVSALACCNRDLKESANSILGLCDEGLVLRFFIAIGAIIFWSSGRCCHCIHLFRRIRLWAVWNVGILRAAGIIFLCILAFDAVSTAAQGSEESEKDMPGRDLGSLVICTVLYLVAVVLTGW